MKIGVSSKRRKNSGVDEVMQSIPRSERAVTVVVEWRKEVKMCVAGWWRKVSGGIKEFSGDRAGGSRSQTVEFLFGRDEDG